MAVLIYCKILAKQFDLDQRFCKYGSLSEGVFPSPMMLLLARGRTSQQSNSSSHRFSLHNRPSFAIR
jgi:DNA polymerase-3 subunit epsilon